MIYDQHLQQQQQLQGNQQGQVDTLPSISTMGALVVNEATTFAKGHKLISGLYIIGIFFIVLIGSGTELSHDQSKQYNQMINDIDLEAEYQASSHYASAEQNYRATKGWFSCDQLCQRNKRKMVDAEIVLKDVREEVNNRMSDAKSVAGIFSEVGVEEVKDSFWNYFSRGKNHAKRQTMWDTLYNFMGFGPMQRNEGFFEFVLRMVLTMLMNFTIGLVVAFFIFIFSLWSIITSYQPNPITAVVFFVGASCAAFAFIASFLFSLFGAVAGGVYGVAKVVESNDRIDQGGQRQNINHYAHQQQQHDLNMYNLPQDQFNSMHSYFMEN